MLATLDEIDAATKGFSIGALRLELREARGEDVALDKRLGEFAGRRAKVKEALR